MKGKDMSERKVRPVGAAALIAEATKRGAPPAPSTKALAELRALCEHNDRAPRNSRVGRDAAIDMLRAMGWTGGRETLNDVCRVHLGRRSYAEA